MSDVSKVVDSLPLQGGSIVVGDINTKNISD